MRTTPLKFLAALLLGTALHAPASTSTWTNRVAGNYNWSNPANWNPNGAPVSVSTTALDFLAGAPSIGNLTINATNNVANPFILNSVVLSGAAPVNGSTATTTLNVQGSQLRFVDDGATGPTLLMNASKPGTNNINYVFATPVELTTDLTIGGSGSNNVTISGQITGTGGITRTNSNTSAVVTLSGSNAFSGNVTIVNGGRITAGNNDALGSTNSPTIVNAGGQIQFAGRTMNEPFTIAGNGWSSAEGALRAGGANRTTLNGPITLSSNAMIKVDGSSSYTINGDITALTDAEFTYYNDNTGSNTIITGKITLGNGRLLKTTGTGLLRLDNTNNTWTGPTYIQTGTLQVGSGGYTGSLPDTVITNNGSLVFLSSNSFTLSQPIYGTGLIQARNYANLTLSASNAFTGILRLGSGSGPVGGGIVRLLNSYALGDGTTAKTNELIRGELRLEGGLDLPAGINFLTSGGTFITDANGGGLIPIHNFSGTNRINGTVTPGGGGGDSEYAVTSGELTLAGTVAPNTSARNLWLTGAGGLGIISGSLSDGTSPLASLRKNGAGTWRLENALNGYSGPTIIYDGTLALGPAASIPYTTSLTLSNGGVFDVSALASPFEFGSRPLFGFGTVKGNYANTGGTVVPGLSNVVGTLTFSTNMTMTFGTLAVDLNTPTTVGQGTNDLLVVGNDFDPGFGVLVVTPQSPLQVGSNYTVVTFGGNRISTFGSVQTGARYNLSLDEATAGIVAVKVDSGGPTNLVWSDATLTGSWDLSLPVWNNNTEKFYQLDSVLFDDSSSNQTVSLLGELKPSSVTVNAASNYLFTGGGKISGVTGMTKNGSGTLTVAGANDFSGQVSVDQGILVTSNNAALGSVVGGTVVASGATLDVSGFNLGLEPVTVSGAGVGGLGAIINTGAEQQNALRNVTFAGNATLGTLSNRFDIRAAALTDPLLKAQGFKLTKKGAYVLDIVANFNAVFDTGLGDIDIEEGSLEIAYNPTLGDPTKTMTLFPGTVFRSYSTGTNILSKQLVMQGGSTYWNNSGANTFAGNVSVPGNVTINVASNTSLTLSGALTGSGAITNLGGGTLIVTGSNDLTGGIYITNGILRLANNHAAGSTNSIITPNAGTGGSGATPRIDLSTGITVPQTVSLVLTSTTTGDLRTLLSASAGTNEWTGPITVSGDGNIQFTADTTNSLILSGPITNVTGSTSQIFLRGTGTNEVRNTIKHQTGRVAKTDSGTWILNSTGNEWTQTRVVVGTLRVGQNDLLPPTALLYLGQDASAAILDLNGTRQTVGEVQNNASTPANYLIGSSSTNDDSLLIYAGLTSSTFNGRIVDSVGTGSRKTALTVSAGSLTLGGSNTYSGATIVTNAALVINTNGFLGNSGLVDVQSGGLFNVSALPSGYTVTVGRTLAGSGTVTGAVAIASGATLSPTGTLTVQGNLTLQGTNLMDLSKASAVTSNDRIQGVNTLVVGGVLKLVISGDALVGGESFNLFGANAIAGTFAAIEPATPGGSLEWDTTDLYSLGILKVKAPFYPATLGAVAFTSPDTVAISALGGTNMTYKVWASTNVAIPISSWWLLGSTNSDSAGVINFIDNTATNSPRFYIFGQ